MILRQDKETSDIPIVFVTASVMSEGTEETNGIANTGFIGKPKIRAPSRKKLVNLLSEFSNMLKSKI